MIKLHQLLGVSQQPKNGLAWHDLLRGGLPASVLPVLSTHLGQSPTYLHELLNVAADAVQCSPAETDSAYRIALAFRQLQTALSKDYVACQSWLQTPNKELKGYVPLELLLTHIGAGYVFAAIARLKPVVAEKQGYELEVEPEVLPD